MKIGIYLGFGREYKNYRFYDQGLGRYLAFLIKGFLDSNVDVTIAHPYWCKSMLFNLFNHYKVDVEKINFLSFQKSRTIWEIYFDYLMDRVHDNKKKSRKNILNEYSVVFINFLLKINSPIIFFILTLFLLILFCLLLLLLSPVIILILLMIFVRKIILSKKIYKGMLIKLGIYNNLVYIKSQFHSRLDLANRVRNDHTYHLINKINSNQKISNSKQDIWFSPMMYWPEFNDINGLKVITVPDLVTTKFPIQFSKEGLIDSSLNCSKTIDRSSNFITFCNYIKNSLLVDEFGKNEESVRVIPHANIEMTKLDNNKNDQAFTRLATHILNMEMRDAFTKIVSSETKYIFYSSQDRPNKNIKSLIHALYILKAKKKIDLKLFLTGYSEDLYLFIKKVGLANDVFCFQHLPQDQLSFLYKNALLIVNPTLYEGGFPFTFSEGMFYGVPSVMSKIPQVTEFIDEKEFSEFLFDPYNAHDIAKKINVGIKNRKLLFSMQNKIYNKLRSRSWGRVASEYLEAFKYFLKKTNNVGKN